MSLPLVGSLDWKSVLVGAIFVMFVLPWITAKFHSTTSNKAQTS